MRFTVGVARQRGKENNVTRGEAFETRYAGKGSRGRGEDEREIGEGRTGRRRTSQATNQLF